MTYIQKKNYLSSIFGEGGVSEMAGWTDTTDTTGEPFHRKAILLEKSENDCSRSFEKRLRQE